MAASEDDAGVEQQESAEAFGARLRKARESRQLTIEQLSAELRVHADALEALELGRFDTLGPPVFAKGYLKQYAARLHMNVPTVTRQFDLLIGDATVDVSPSRSLGLRRDNKPTRRIVISVVIILLAGLGLYLWFRQPEPFSIFNALFD